MTTDTVSTRFRSTTCLLTLVCTLITSSATAETFETAFGFQLELPDQWIMLNRQTLETKYEGEDLNSLNLAGSFPNQTTADATFAGIQEGRYQYFFNRAENEDAYANYVGLKSFLCFPHTSQPSIKLKFF